MRNVWVFPLGAIPTARTGLLVSLFVQQSGLSFCSDARRIFFMLFIVKDVVEKINRWWEYFSFVVENMSECRTGHCVLQNFTLEESLRLGFYQSENFF